MSQVYDMRPFYYDLKALQDEGRVYMNPLVRRAAQIPAGHALGQLAAELLAAYDAVLRSTLGEALRSTTTSVEYSTPIEVAHRTYWGLLEAFEAALVAQGGGV